MNASDKNQKIQNVQNFRADHLTIRHSTLMDLIVV